ncbi:MAG: ferrous iron transport protein B [Bacteroidales bacterium]|jgi:ferrous iron transport protein B|nr:ferrous iron transport protein B [Bacteroidales bacterium]
MNLSEINKNQKVQIVRVKGRSAFRHRITEMGFVKGQTVEVLHTAPLLDPIVYKILNSEISLRKEEAMRIEVAEIIETATSNMLRTVKHDNCYQDVVASVAVNGTAATASAANLKKRIEVAMVGNPNAGKTSVYNMLSGEFEHVGNYSGVTVDSKTVIFNYKGYEIVLTDLPGSYSLSPYSPEERFVRDTLIEKSPDIIINVIDASNIERNLYLTTQLIDMDMTLLLAVNMSDEMEKQGATLNYDLFGKLLGAPVVKTVARTGLGKEEVLDKLLEIYNDQEKTNRHTHIPYNEDSENYIKELQNKIYKDSKYIDAFSSRFLAIKFLEDDTALFEKLNCFENITPLKALAESQRVSLRNIYDEEPDQVLSNSRYAFVNGILKETYTENPQLKNKQHSKDIKIDNILTHKIWSFPIFLFFLWVMFQATFVIGEYPVEWIESGVSWLNDALQKIIPDSWIKDMMLDGVLAGIGGVIVFLPNILIMFFFISIMEATGYMARVAFIMDKFMHTIGLHGRSFVPMIIGFGCNVPAIMATRTIENKKDRIITMLIIPFMSCSARLPVYVFLVGTFFSANFAGTIIFGIYLFGILVSVLSALLFSKTLLKHEDSPFVIEMPPYRVPTFKFVLRYTGMRANQFLKKIGGVVVLLSMVVWVLGYFPRVDETAIVAATVGTGIATDETAIDGTVVNGKAIDDAVINETAIDEAAKLIEKAQLEQSYLGKIGHFVEPVLRPLGFDWRMGICLLTGVAAKETVASTMQILFDVSEIFTPLTALAFIAFILLYMPCLAVFATVRRESGSWKWSLFLMFYTTSVAYIVSLLVYQIGSLFG